MKLRGGSTIEPSASPRRVVLGAAFVAAAVFGGPASAQLKTVRIGVTPGPTHGFWS
jgi:hypothetical protein